MSLNGSFRGTARRKAARSPPKQTEKQNQRFIKMLKLEDGENKDPKESTYRDLGNG